MRIALRRAALATLLIVPAVGAHAQGCAQCRDNTASTPPRTQAAYRRAIILLTSAGCGLFAATLAVARRNR